MVPENIHTPPTEGIGNSGEEGGSQRPKNLKQCIKLNWNFRRGWGGGGSLGKSLPWGGYGYFLELHNNCQILKQSVVEIQCVYILLLYFLKQA